MPTQNSHPLFLIKDEYRIVQVKELGRSTRDSVPSLTWKNSQATHPTRESKSFLAGNRSHFYSSGNSLGDRLANVFSRLWVEEPKAILRGHFSSWLCSACILTQVLNVDSEQGSTWSYTSFPAFRKAPAEIEVDCVIIHPSRQRRPA